MPDLIRHPVDNTLDSRACPELRRVRGNDNKGDDLWIN